MKVRVEGALTSAVYDVKMACGFNKCCFAAVISGLLVSGFASAANSESGFHAQSRNLPATNNTNGRDCSELMPAEKPRGADYMPDRMVAPADVEPVRSKDFPIVRFDLGLGKGPKNRFISPGIKNSRLQAKSLTVGEVSIDTFNGEVALDGRPLTPKRSRYDC